MYDGTCLLGGVLETVNFPQGRIVGVINAVQVQNQGVWVFTKCQEASAAQEPLFT